MSISELFNTSNDWTKLNVKEINTKEANIENCIINDIQISREMTPAPPISEYHDKLYINSNSGLLCSIDSMNNINEYITTGGGSGSVSNPMTVNLDANEYNIVNCNSVESNAFIKTSGTSQQYLMADGSSLQYSANSGNSNFYLYNNGTDQDPTPSNGFITYNNVEQKNATIIYISHRTRDNIDIEVFFKQLSQSNDVYIQDQSNSDNNITYNIVGSPTIINQQYVIINVIVSSYQGTGELSFGNGHNILISFFTNSIEVDQRISNLEGDMQNITGDSTGSILTKSLTHRIRSGVDLFQIQNINTNLNTITISTDLINCYKPVNCNTTITATGGFIINGTGSSFLKSNGGTDSNTYLTIGDAGTIYATNTNLTSNYYTNLVSDNRYVQKTGNNILTGSITATQFIKTSGNSTQFLKADGTVSIFNFDQSQRLYNLFYNNQTDVTTFNINMESWRYSSWGYVSPTTISNVDCPSGSMSHLGGSLATFTTDNSSPPKSLKNRVRSTPSNTSDGATSGWLGANTHPSIFIGAGFYVKIGFSLDAATSVSTNRTMIGLFQSTTRPVINSTIPISSITVGSMGIIQERSENTFFFS